MWDTSPFSLYVHMLIKFNTFELHVTFLELCWTDACPGFMLVHSGGGHLVAKCFHDAIQRIVACWEELYFVAHV